METLPVIDGLTNDQFERLLKICTKKTIPKDTVIYMEGQPSEDMFILTEGILQVNLWGKEINRIFPIATVGEMGMFTGETRSADVVTKSSCTLLHISKDDLFALFEEDKDLYIHFQQGMILDMARKLRVTDELIAKLRSKIGKR